MLKIFFIVPTFILSFFSVTWVGAKNLEQLQTLNKHAESFLSFSLDEGSITDSNLIDIVQYGDDAFKLIQIVPTNSSEYSRTYEILGKLGKLLYQRREQEEAIRLLLPFAKLGFQSPNPVVGRCAYWLGKAYLSKGDNTSSERYLLQALPIMIKDEDPYLHILYNNLGLACKRQGKSEKSISYYKKSAKIKCQLAPNKISIVYNNIVPAYLSLGQLDSAYEYIQKCFANTEDSSVLHHAYTNRGRYYEIMGRLKNEPNYHQMAIQEHNSALAIRLELNLVRSLFNSYMNLGANNDYLGNYSEAQEFYEQAMRYDFQYPWTDSKIKLRENLAEIYFNQGLFSEAIDFLNRVIDTIKLDKYGELEPIQKKYILERLNKRVEIYRIGKLKYQQSVLISLSISIGLILIFLLYKEKDKRRKVQEKVEKTIEQNSAKLAQEIIEIQEKIYIKIGQILHDDIQNYLTIWQYGLCENTEKETRAKISKLSEKVRKISHQLLPYSSKHEIMIALRELCSPLNTSKSPLRVELHSMEVKNRRFSGSVESAIYRIVQEALNNIIRHSKAKNVSIQLIHYNEGKEYISLVIEDDGRGFKVNDHNNGVGLSLMRDRIENLRGSLVIDSKPGRGTIIIAEIPAEIKGIEVYVK